VSDLPAALGSVAGEIAGLASAFTWALSSILIRAATQRGNVVFINAVRLVAACVVYLGGITLAGRWGEVLAIPMGSLVPLLLAVVVGLVVGDTVFFKSQAYMGVARALPVSGTYPLFTLLLSSLVLGEPLRWQLGASAALVMVGLYLLTTTPRGRPATLDVPADRTVLAGVAMALLAALAWSCSTMLLRVSLGGTDVVAANAIRLPFALVILSAMLAQQGNLTLVRCYTWRALAPVLVAGVLGTGLGSTAFLLSVQLAGPAKAAIISSASPLFGAPMSVLLLHEQLSLSNVAGIVLCVVGIWLVV
jgi:DME family drug/metabolite transporter